MKEFYGNIMKFRLTTSRQIYNDKCKEIAILSELGFTFASRNFHGKERIIIEEDVEIEINSLEELMKFIEKISEEVIISKSPACYGESYTIEIYND